ncbi:BAHD acyltransferase BIA1-like [Benincasa hispida]|uniref:BAHD acyltransferase BIA1-like n=1 Tax=Benincasa hispida TaxID=102211 RepID=UPI0018FFC5AB|nr:BAHD acyltransferase BIA1-like [Benincasa hispida]
MEVKVLSRETIIPSSPTPPHLQTFQLSLLDQLSPMLYIPLLFFYPMKTNYDIDHQDPKKTIATLKNSLSKTLSRFYLLAGRITDKSIHCNDKGAVFQEATVSCNMFEILKEPNSEVLAKLLPCSLSCTTKPIEEYTQIVVQANIFKCGGIAISLCLLHKLIDAATFSCFLRSWATTNRELLLSFDSSPNNNMACYDYNSFSSLFPQTNLLPFHKAAVTLSTTPARKHHLQRFVFRSKAILDLKAKAKSSDVPNPTCVETLTGFIWKYAMKVADHDNSQKQSTLSHVVNMRKIIEPSLPEDSVGNILWGTVAHYYSTTSHEEMEDLELSKLVSLLRQSFKKVNNKEYIKELIMESDKGRSDGVMKLVGEINKCPLSNYYFFTSWKNMNLNEVDFGWGKPLWFAIAGDSNEMMKGNFVILLDSVLDDGSMEAWILLDEKKMQLLDQNQQFLEFALLNPSINFP